MRHALTIWIAAASLAVGCKAPAPADSGQLTPSEVAELNQRIIDWLECEECRDGELERVTALGAEAVPALVATLERGPSPAKVETLRRSLADSYARLAAYAEQREDVVSSMSETEYVRLYTENFVARYQARAAVALRRIGGSAAEAALETAARGEHRPDVQAAIRGGAN